MSCTAIRFVLVSALMLAEPVTPNENMIILFAAAAVVYHYIEEQHQARLIARAMRKAKSALIAAVSKSHEQ